MNSWKDFKGAIRHHIPLADMTSFRIGGPARIVVSPVCLSDFKIIQTLSHDEHIPVRVLGGGTNVLASDDGFDGIIIRMDSQPYTRLKPVYGETGAWVASVGCSLPKLVTTTTNAGDSGMEKLAGIPGTLGGALRMNAGGRHGEIGECVEYVDVIDSNGDFRRLTRDEAGFRYRGSNLGAYIIIAAKLNLVRGDSSRIVAIRRRILSEKKASQPLGARSAGCIFKNPPDDSAGRLIDSSGLKGARIGGASVSDTHANFIVNTGSARYTDIIKLIKKIRKTVEEKHNVELELEVKPWDTRIAS